MTTQKAYERIREYFSRPGSVLAQDEDGGCFYRIGQDAKSPQKCAIGCLIPDSRYRKFFDNGIVTPETIIKILPSLEGVDVSFLLDVQTKHDVSKNVATFLVDLDKVAFNHGLTPVAA